MQTKTAFLKQLQGVTLIAKSDSNHWIIMDGSPTFGGSSAGSSPKELLLMALGGCTSNDVIPILKKKKVELDGFEIHLTGTVREEHPQVFTDIHIEYVFYGEQIHAEDVERAIELSTTKYCSITAMLSAIVKITHSYRIEEKKNE
ncbi:MAG: OsmC family protein [Ignavibacteria bacterium]|nr:OsmC family protein [Ignavibacteria bacterium]